MVVGLAEIEMAGASLARPGSGDSWMLVVRGVATLCLVFAIGGGLQGACRGRIGVETARSNAAMRSIGMGWTGPVTRWVRYVSRWPEGRRWTGRLSGLGGAAQSRTSYWPQARWGVRPNIVRCDNVGVVYRWGKSVILSSGEVRAEGKPTVKVQGARVLWGRERYAMMVWKEKSIAASSKKCQWALGVMDLSELRNIWKTKLPLEGTTCEWDDNLGSVPRVDLVGRPAMLIYSQWLEHGETVSLAAISLPDGRVAWRHDADSWEARHGDFGPFWHVGEKVLLANWCLHRSAFSVRTGQKLWGWDPVNSFGLHVGLSCEAGDGVEFDYATGQYYLASNGRMVRIWLDRKGRWQRLGVSTPVVCVDRRLVFAGRVLHRPVHWLIEEYEAEEIGSGPVIGMLDTQSGRFVWKNPLGPGEIVALLVSPRVTLLVRNLTSKDGLGQIVTTGYLTKDGTEQWTVKLPLEKALHRPFSVGVAWSGRYLQFGNQKRCLDFSESSRENRGW